MHSLLVSSSPRTNIYLSKNALNYALSLSLCDNQTKSIFFIGEGIYNLVHEKDSANKPELNYLKGWKLLAFEDIDYIYIDSDYLYEERIDINSLYLPVNKLVLLSRIDILNKFINSDVTIQI